jgi:UDP-N-acetylmuramoyl-tripeptide--D-alanyl-D-alanine ligase
VTKQRMHDAVKRAICAYFSFWAQIVLRAHEPFIIGVTGSVGKTTTKEAIAAVLSHPDARHVVRRVHKSPGNLNDNLGHALAILRFPDWAQTRLRLAWWIGLAPFKAFRLALFEPRMDVLVLEYALSPNSDFARLVRLAPPDVAVVTAIGPAHLETFGSIEGIAHEKGRLVRAVPANGLVVLGLENPCLAEMSRESVAPVVTAGGIGRELSNNIARTVGAFVGVPEHVVEDALRTTRPVTRRLKFFDLGAFTVIDDTINANPMSMRLALTTLDARASGGQRRIAMLAFMAELGEQSASYHREIGAFARDRADLVIGVGPLAREYAPDWWFADANECARQLPRIVQAGDLVLVKGSASAHMDVVAGALKRHAKQLRNAAA